MQASIYFPKVRRMLLFHAPLILKHFWPAPTLLRGHLALATLSPPETDPQILERWGCADEVIRAKDFCLEFSVTYSSLCEFHTLDWFLHVCALPWDTLRRLHVVKDATQLSCVRWSTSNRSLFQLITRLTLDSGSPRSVVTFVTVDSKLPCSIKLLILLQHGYCTFLIILFGPFARLFINLTLCIRALLSKPATTLGLVEQAFWRVLLFTEWVVASSFVVILAGPSRHSTTGTISSGTSGSRCFSLILLHERILRRIRLCHFCTLIDIVTETTIVSSGKLPVGFPLPTISKNCPRRFVPDSWPRRSSRNFLFSDPKIFISNFLLDTSLHHSFQSVLIRS